MDNWRDVTNTKVFQSSFKGAKLLYGYTPKTWAEQLKKEVEKQAGGIAAASFNHSLGTAFTWRLTELGDDYYRAIYVTSECPVYQEGNHTFI